MTAFITEKRVLHYGTTCITTESTETLMMSHASPTCRVLDEEVAKGQALKAAWQRNALQAAAKATPKRQRLQALRPNDTSGHLRPRHRVGRKRLIARSLCSVSV